MAKCNNCQSKDWIKACTVNEQGEHHSFNDEPSIISKNGNKQWHKNGLVHRDNGLPASIWCSGRKWWVINGNRHRTNGPAAIYPDGREFWWYKGKEIICVKKLSEITFQYEEKVGTILENIEDKIYLGLLGDEKIMIGLEDG